jgi:hypothetical protein
MIPAAGINDAGYNKQISTICVGSCRGKLAGCMISNRRTHVPIPEQTSMSMSKSQRKG